MTAPTNQTPRTVWPRIRDLPEAERAPFGEWLNKYGQTCPWLEGEPESEQDGYYVGDYKRWAWRRPVID
jgi:hypothetical protein